MGCLDAAAVCGRPLKFKKKSLALELCRAFALYSLAYAVSKNWDNDATKAIAYVFHWEPREYIMGREMEFYDE